MEMVDIGDAKNIKDEFQFLIIFNLIPTISRRPLRFTHN